MAMAARLIGGMAPVMPEGPIVPQIQALRGQTNTVAGTL